MFKITSIMIACGLLKVAESLKLESSADCCSTGCAVMMTSCDCDCDEEPEPPLEPPCNGPEDCGNLPPELANVELNLDVLLTHIMHEVHPEQELYDPNTPEEHTFITEVIEPVVI